MSSLASSPVTSLLWEAWLSAEADLADAPPPDKPVPMDLLRALVSLLTEETDLATATVALVASEVLPLHT